MSISTFLYLLLCLLIIIRGIKFPRAKTSLFVLGLSFISAALLSLIEVFTFPTGNDQSVLYKFLSGVLLIIGMILLIISVVSKSSKAITAHDKLEFGLTIGMWSIIFLLPIFDFGSKATLLSWTAPGSAILVSFIMILIGKIELKRD